MVGIQMVAGHTDGRAILVALSRFFSTADLYPINNGLQQMWYDPANDAGATPSVARNSGGDYDDGNVTFLAGALILHPCGNDGHAYAHTIWTAPRRGRYLVSSVFYAQQNSINVDVHVLVNGRSVFTDVLVENDTKRTFVREFILKTGDTIDFAVGPNGAFFLHPGNTGLDAQIAKIRGVGRAGGDGQRPLVVGQVD